MENVSPNRPDATSINQMKLISLLLLFSLSIFGLGKSSGVGEHALYLDSDEYDNGYPESKYNSVLDTFIEIYSPIIAKRGGTFHILRDFSDGAVNAWAWRIGNEYHLEIPGGMSRYHLINEEGFITIICHEIGHMLGGAPFRSDYNTISVEGQSDYFSTSKCLRRMLRAISPYKPISMDSEVEKICKDSSEENCERAFSGMKSITSYFAKIEKVKAPGLFSDSTRVVSRTLKAHPKSQCRLDTMKRGFLCPVDEDVDFSSDDNKTGSCHQDYFPEFSRPKCWFRE